MPRPLTLAAWETARAPTDNDRRREAAWLEEHWVYGSRIHETAAAAIVEALSAPSERAVGHGLYFKLFAEFANALEVAGAWGWVIRSRRDHQLLLDAFLAYPFRAPRDFYTAARRNRSGSLVRLLNLPAESKVVDALDVAIPEWTRDECQESLADCVRHSKFLADRYFAENEIIKAAYNRAKHGATILHHPSLTPREFYVIAPHLDVRGPRDTTRYDLPKFTVDRKMVRSLEHGVAIAGALSRYLAGLARALNNAGLLYPSRRT